MKLRFGDTKLQLSSNKYTGNTSFTLTAIVILSLFPYISLGPLSFGTEVQPWPFLLAWVFFVYRLVSDKVSLTRFHALLFLFSIIFLIYIPFGGVIDLQSYIRKSAAFLLCIPLLVAIQFIHPSIILNILKYSSIIWLLFAVFGELSPNLYLSLVKSIVPNALGAFGDRGVTSLAPEATDFGFTMVYFWALALVCSDQARREGATPAPTWVYAVIFLNILLSRSASGIFAICILLFIYRISHFDKERSSKGLTLTLLSSLALLMAVIFTSLALGDDFQSGIRGLDLLVSTISNPEGLINTTFSYRIAHNLVGIFGLFDSNFLGWGSSTFLQMSESVYHLHGIGQMLGLEGWYAENVPSTLSTHSLAMFPVIVFEYGVFGIALIFLIFCRVLRSDSSLKMVIFSLLFLTWFQSFPIAYPLFWMLLGTLDWRRNYVSSEVK